MNLHEYRLLFFTVIGTLALLVASPVLSRLLVFPQTEFFTELWILGPNHMAEDYPFNITQNSNYSIFLGISNHLGYCAYYLVEVKFCNQSQSAPNIFNRTSSDLPPLFNITAFVADKETLELPLTFSFDYTLNETLLQVQFRNMTLNEVTLDIRDRVVEWDPEKNGFFANLFFELWIFNTTKSEFQYHERFVGLRLNMTR